MQESLEPVTRLLGVLADPNRMRILCVLTEDCQHVSEIVATTGLPQPLVSHHLRVLKQHGLAKSERQGAYTTYCFSHREMRKTFVRLCDLARQFAALEAEASS